LVTRKAVPVVHTCLEQLGSDLDAGVDLRRRVAKGCKFKAWGQSKESLCSIYLVGGDCQKDNCRLAYSRATGFTRHAVHVPFSPSEGNATIMVQNRTWRWEFRLSKLQAIGWCPEANLSLLCSTIAKARPQNCRVKILAWAASL